MSVKRKIVLPLALVLSAGITGSVIYGGIKHKQKADAREADVQKVMGRLKACPDTFKIRGVRECHPSEVRDKLETEAEELIKQGKYEEAGMNYIKLMGPTELESKVRDMANKCAENGNPEGRDRILKELSIKMEALNRVIRGE